MNIEFSLQDDGLGRLFRVVEKRGWCVLNYPCRTCLHGVFDVDRYCCKKLPHGWDDMDEFYGENAYPFDAVADAAKAAAGHRINWASEDVEFYDCDSRNS